MEKIFLVFSLSYLLSWAMQGFPSPRSFLLVAPSNHSRCCILRFSLPNKQPGAPPKLIARLNLFCYHGTSWFARQPRAVPRHLGAVGSAHHRHQSQRGFVLDLLHSKVSKWQWELGLVTVSFLIDVGFCKGQSMLHRRLRWHNPNGSSPHWIHAACHWCSRTNATFRSIHWKIISGFLVGNYNKCGVWEKLYEMTIIKISRKVDECIF